MTRIFKSVVVLVLALILACGLIACNNAPTPSEKTFKKAYDKKINETIEEIGDYYDLVDDYDFQNLKFDGGFSVELSDDLLSLIRSYTSYDFDWVNDAKIKISENFKGEMISLALGLAYADTDLATVDVIMDTAGKDVFMGVPVLSDTFAEMQDVLLEETASSLNAMMKELPEGILPDEKALENLIKKVYSTFMENIDEVFFEETELVANGVAQACIEYKVELSEKDIARIAIAVLELLENDEDFKTVVCDFVEAFDVSFNSIDYTPQEAYDELVEEIADAIDSLELLLEDEDEASDETALIWTSYITEKLDIIGTKIDFLDEYSTSTLYIASATSKNTIGVEIYVGSDDLKYVELGGEFVVDGKKLSGTYELKVEGESMLFIDLDDIDVKKMEKGYFVGSISIAPSKGLIQEMTNGADLDFSVAGLTLSSLSLKIDVEENDKDSSKMSISLMSGSDPYVSIFMDSRVSEGETITVSDKTTEDLMEWVTSFDANELVKRVEESGLPEYIVEIVQYFATMLEFQ